ncbi:MAG: 4Fe-4S dicluster domain-containing protein [Candidatus Goldbacteria bacterium]|nr:4Fe-4S dicluster domain-containing protein [Candidatus Goldiibacteriota bacterium]
MNPELSRKILDDFKKLPAGEKINECIQCGTCSASCPVAAAMENTPRKIIAMLRADKIDEVLQSDTVWLCASCYSCTVRCPAGIKFTDFMYQLKRMGVKYNIKPKNKSGLKLAQSFCETVKRNGRDFEPELLIRYNLRTNIFNFLKIIPLGLNLFFKNRMPVFPSKVKGVKNINRALNKVK